MKVRLNEDKEIVARIKEGLKRTGGYCPCRLAHTEENKCMCEEFRNQIKDPNFEGYCHCMLYYKENKRRPGVRTYGRRAEFIELNYAFIMALSAIPHCRKQFRR